MGNNDIQRVVLGQFVDSLISQKYPGQPAENFKELREKSIDEIDKKIDMAFCEDLTIEQLEEISSILDRNEEDPSAFEEFFKKSGVDTAKKTKEVLESYRTSFLGGSNEE